MPNAIVLLSEYWPARARATSVTLIYVGYTIGSAFGGVIAAYLIPAYGWQSVFMLGGLAPLIVVATDSGRTALALSNRRPTATILALTRTEQVARLLALCWGVTAVVAPERLQAGEELPFAIDWARGRKLVQPGQRVVLLRGEMLGQVKSRAVLAAEVH